MEKVLVQEVVAGELVLPIQGIGQTGNLYLVTDHAPDLAWVTSNKELQFVVPLDPQLLKESKNNQQWEEGERQRLVWDLPSVVFDGEWQILQDLVDEAVRAGFSRFRLNNLAHLDLFQRSSNVQLAAGPWLYTLNSQAIMTMQDLGIQQFSLSLEDERENITALLAGAEQENLLLTVYSPIDLFTSRITPSFQDQVSSLQNDSGDLLHLHDERGLTVTRAHDHFSLLGKLHLLREMGCCNFVIDLRGSGLQSRQGQQVLQAFHEDIALPETSSFNFERGLT